MWARELTNHERAVTVSAREQKHVIDPPHPTPPVSDHERAVLVSVREQER